MTGISYVLHGRGTDTKIRVSTESWPWRRKYSRRSCWNSNPRLFSHESCVLTTELSLLATVTVGNYSDDMPITWLVMPGCFSSFLLQLNTLAVDQRVVVLSPVWSKNSTVSPVWSKNSTVSPVWSKNSTVSMLQRNSRGRGSQSFAIFPFVIVAVVVVVVVATAAATLVAVVVFQASLMYVP